MTDYMKLRDELDALAKLAGNPTGNPNDHAVHTGNLDNALRRHFPAILSALAQAADAGRYKEALRPFAEKAQQAMDGYTETWTERMGPEHPVFGWNGPVFTLGDFLAAIAALQGEA